MFLIILNTNRDHPDEPTRMFTLFVMQHKLHPRPRPPIPDGAEKHRRPLPWKQVFSASCWSRGWARAVSGGIFSPDERTKPYLATLLSHIYRAKPLILEGTDREGQKGVGAFTPVDICPYGQKHQE